MMKDFSVCFGQPMARPALSATRAVAVLNFLAAHAAEEFTLSDLAARLDINLASAHSLLIVLTDAGYIARHGRLRTYSLGPSVVALGHAALERHPAIAHAYDEARRLSEEVGLGVTVTALAGEDIVFLERVGEHRPRDIGVHVGERVPMMPPIGAVFAAWHNPEPWLARAGDRAKMEAVLADVRSRGWAAALGDPPRTEYEALGALNPRRGYDVVMIAAPVFDHSGDAIVSLTLLGMESGLPGHQVTVLGTKVRDAGLVATRRSGGRPPAG
jgi:DNA-binding IclR family transcriptional regulator